MYKNLPNNCDFRGKGEVRTPASSFLTSFYLTTPYTSQNLEFSYTSAEQRFETYPRSCVPGGPLNAIAAIPKKSGRNTSQIFLRSMKQRRIPKSNSGKACSVGAAGIRMCRLSRAKKPSDWLERYHPTSPQRASAVANNNRSTK